MEKRSSIRTLVVLRDRILRRVLADRLAGESTLDVVHSTSIIDACVLLDLIQEHQVDIVLLHVDGDAQSGRQCARALSRMNHDALLIISGLSTSDTEIMAAIEAGAAGIATNRTKIDELVANIEAIARGETLCSPHVARMLFSRVAERSVGGRAACNRSRITRREREVVALIEQGMSNKAIAAELCIEVQTVKNHVHNILEKLDFRRRTQIARFARQEGWFDTRTSTRSSTGNRQSKH